MKIALIGQKGLPAHGGGIETHVDHLAKGLVKNGEQVFAYTRPWYTPRYSSTYEGVNLISLTSINTKHLDAISHSFFASVHALFQNFHVIHYHGVGPALCSWIPRVFKPSVKIVTTFHCIDRKHQKWGVIARMALRLGEWFAVKFAHKTIVVSKTLKLYCQQAYEADTVYIPNGVESQEQVSHNIIEKELGLKKDSYILFLSRLVRHKGAHLLIKAYQKLNTNKKLVIAGGSAFTDDYVAEVKLLANGNPNIIFTEVKAHTDLWRELYSNAYLFVLPSETEGLPIVVLEAMSFENTVLGSDIPEIAEVVGENEYGFLFKNKSVRDLKEKLEYLLAHPKLVKETGQLASQLVAKEYNWKNIVKAVDSVYHNLVEHKKNRQMSVGAVVGE